MSALSSQVTLAQTDRSAVGLVCRESRQDGSVLQSICEQLRALFIAHHRSLGGPVGNSAWAAEDDYARFSHRSR